MANATQQRPYSAIRADLGKAGLNEYTQRAIMDMLVRSDKVLTNLGQVNQNAPIVGRAEGVGTTAQNLDATGKLLTTDAIAADGTGSPLTGGKRGFVALDTNNRLSGTFRNNPVNSSGRFTGANPLTVDSTGLITIAASTIQFGDGTVSYNSGTIASGQAAGTIMYVYADNPTFSGGAVTYQFTTNGQTVFAANGRTYFGTVTVPGAGSSGGTGGGTGGGRGTL